MTATYTTSFRDIEIDNVPYAFSGIATVEYDEIWNQYFCKTIELFGVAKDSSRIILRRINRDNRLNYVFSKLEDALLPRTLASNRDREIEYHFDHVFG